MKGDLKKIVIIIPTAFPEQGLRVAHSLVNQSDEMVSVLVVDNSKSGLGSECPELGKMPVQIIQQKMPGLLVGRHSVLNCDNIRESEVIIYLDDDISFPDNWLRTLLEPFKNSSIDLVGCRYLPDYESDPPSWLNNLWWEDESGFRMLGHLSLLDGGGRSREYDPTYVWGLCYAIRKSALIELGGFHPDGYPWNLRRFRGDGETGLSQKAKSRGYMAYYQAETHVLHKVPKSRMKVEYFERRSFLQGISDSYSRIRERRAADQPIRVNPFKKFYGHLRQSGQRARILREPTAEGVKFLMGRAYRDGFEFHQTEVRKDPALLDWVLKPDYFDYRLPAGWEKYLQ
jgi:glycosyltransferase involved in cell wall biosynthesis